MPLLEEGSGLVAGADFHARLQPGADRPGQPDVELREHAEDRVRDRRRRRCDAVDGVLRARSSTRSCPCRPRREAELAKLLENTFRHVNIALVNELAMFAHELGIDIWEAIDAASTKPFGSCGSRPGPGVGGHCLPIDPRYLSWRVRRALGHAFRFVELANDVNDHMPDYVVTRDRRRSSTRGARRSTAAAILLLGLAYKKNTGDARESPARRGGPQLLATRRRGVRVSTRWSTPRHVPGPRDAGRVDAERARGGRPRAWCSPTTTRSTGRCSSAAPRTSSTRGTGWATPMSTRCSERRAPTMPREPRGAEC